MCMRIVFMTFEIVGLRTCSQRCNMLAKFVIVCYLDIVLLVVVVVAVIRITLTWESGNTIAHSGEPIYVYTLPLLSFHTNSNKNEEIFFLNKNGENGKNK